MKQADLNDDDKENYIEVHADSLSRILFIYAKLNPGIKYTQGMNEVLAIIYICFTHLTDAEMPIIEPKYNEASLFHAFSNIMIDLRDGFLRELDKEESGISGHI